MKKIINSATNVDLLNALDERLVEQRHRHLWVYLYSSRHAHLQLHQPHGADGISKKKRDKLLDDTFSLLGKFNHQELLPDIFNRDMLQTAIHEFCFGIAYALHRRQMSDGFVDPRFERTVTKYEYFIDSLTPREKAVTSKLHELTYKYGIPITELWLPLLHSKELLEIFTKQYPNTRKNFPFPSLIFTKKDNHPKGIEVSMKRYPEKIHGSWDLVVCTKENQIFSEIESKIKASWRNSGYQVIGDLSDHDIAFYIEKSKCSMSYAINFIRLQIDYLTNYNNRIITPLIADEIPSSRILELRHQKNERKKLSTKINQIKISEGITSKRWSVDKSNVRRSVGLYLWDKIHVFSGFEKSRKHYILELIDELKEKTPDILDLYLADFNEYDSSEGTTKVGDSAKSLETVVREMEADFDLTAHCVKNFDFFSPYDLRVADKY